MKGHQCDGRDGRLYLVEGVETVGGLRVTAHQRGEAAFELASRLREDRWLSVRCVRWED